MNVRRPATAGCPTRRVYANFPVILKLLQLSCCVSLSLVTRLFLIETKHARCKKPIGGITINVNIYERIAYF